MAIFTAEEANACLSSAQDICSGIRNTYSWWMIDDDVWLEVEVSDEWGWDGATEAQHRGRHDDGRRRLEGRDDVAHRDRQDKLGQEDHAADDADICTHTPHLISLLPILWVL